MIKYPAESTLPGHYDTNWIVQGDRSRGKD